MNKKYKAVIYKADLNWRNSCICGIYLLIGIISFLSLFIGVHSFEVYFFRLLIACITPTLGYKIEYKAALSQTEVESDIKSINKRFLEDNLLTLMGFIAFMFLGYIGYVKSSFESLFVVGLLSIICLALSITLIINSEQIVIATTQINED